MPYISGGNESTDLDRLPVIDDIFEPDLVHLFTGDHSHFLV